MVKGDGGVGVSGKMWYGGKAESGFWVSEEMAMWGTVVGNGEMVE